MGQLGIINLVSYIKALLMVVEQGMSQLGSTWCEFGYGNGLLIFLVVSELVKFQDSSIQLPCRKSVMVSLFCGGDRLLLDQHDSHSGSRQDQKDRHITLQIRMQGALLQS